MTTRPFGIAIAGTGIMGRRMLATLTPHPRFRVVRLWDPDAVALQDALAAAPGARRAADLDELVTDPAVDLVYVASPPSLHLSGVRAALDAGKACLCEKPLAASVHEAEALRDLVVGSGLPFAVNFPFASAAASRALIDLAQSGAVGEVRDASITLRFARWPRPWQAGAGNWLAGPVDGGFTREVLSHFVFLALRLFGPATVAEATVTRVAGHAETALRARIVHAGVELSIDAAVAGDVADRNRFEVVGSTGVAALVDWSRLEVDAGVAVPAPGAVAGSAAAGLDRLAAMLDGRTDHDLATADEALAVVRVIEALLAS